MLISFSNTLSSPLLTEIAADMGTDVALAGYLPTITTLFMGISVMASTVVMEKMGLRYAMTIAMLLVTAGNGFGFCANSFLGLLAGRALVGIGMGIAGTGFSTVACDVFRGKAQSAFVTIYTLGNTLATYVCFAAAIPLYKLMARSWRACYLLAAIAAAVLTLAWFIIVRNSEGGCPPAELQKKQRGLRKAMGDRDVWVLTVYHSLAILCTNIITNYLPSYLQIVRGFEAGEASSWSGIISLAGMIGTAVGGAASTALGRRKPVIIVSTLLSLISMVGLLLWRQPAAIVMGIAVFGFCTRCRIPATTSVSTELRKFDTAFASGAYALMYGVGSVIGIAAPPALSAATRAVGMETAMLCFAGFLAAAAVISIFVKETGPCTSSL